MKKLLPVILEEILLPELITWLKRRREAGQPLPTKEEILAQLDADAERFLAAGEAFLAKHGAL